MSQVTFGNATGAQAAYEARINAERARRIEAGVPLSVTGHVEQIHMQGREEDKTNLTNLAMAAQLRLAANPATAETTVFRDRNNVNHTLTQPQMLELWQQAVTWVSAMYAASWALKLMPRDTDVTDDGHWPD